MRTLKKALCLVLAVVMVLGLGVFSTASAEFTDADKVSPQFKEAVDVLETVGALKGNGSGAVNPGDTFTRAEAAVMIVRLMGYDDSRLTGVSTFSDVPDWAQPSVALLESNGIVAGNGSGRFLADQSITGVQFAKMLLGVLEYDAGIEGLANAGEQWVINTVKLAKTSGIADDIMDLVNDSNITREVAAKMTLNALKAPMVMYTNKGTTVTVNGAEVTTGASKAEPQRSWEAKYQQIDDDNVQNEDGFSIELGESLYDGDLRFTHPADDHGNMSNMWTYKTKELGPYTKPTDASFTSKVTFADLYQAMGSNVIDNSVVIDIWVDGVQKVYQGALNFHGRTDGNYGGIRTNDITRNNKDEFVFTDNSGRQINPTGSGALTNVYWDYQSDLKGYWVVITVTNYYLMKATADYNSSKNTLSVELYATVDNEKGNYVPRINNSRVDGEDHPEVVGASKDDFFVVTVKPNDDDVVDIYPAETLEQVEVSSFRTEDSVTVEGTTYKYNQTMDFATRDDDMVGYLLYHNNPGYKLDGSKYNFYLDPNGYIVGAEANNGGTKASDFVFVKEAIKNGWDYSAKIVLMDGTEETVKIDKVNDDDPALAPEKNGDPAQNLFEKRFYSYTARSDGSYRLWETSDPDNDGISQDYVDIDARTQALFANTSRPINNRTNFIANSKTVTVAKKTAYTGVANLPKVYAGEKAITIYYLYNEDDNTLIAIYTDTEGVSDNEDTNLVYIFNNYTGSKSKASQAQSGDDTYYVYDAIDNEGNLIDDFNVDEDGKNIPNGLYDIRSFNKDGWALGDMFATSSTVYKAASGDEKYDYGAGVVIHDDYDRRDIKHADGVVTVNTNSGTYTYALANDAQIYLITDESGKDADVETLNPSGISSIPEDGLYEYYVVYKSSDNKTVERFYIVKLA